MASITEERESMPVVLKSCTNNKDKFLTFLLLCDTLAYHLYESCRSCIRSCWYRNQRALEKHAYVPTDIEHLANIITHGAWIIPSYMQSFSLLQLARSEEQVYCAVVYALALCALFTTSTIFHLISFAHSKLNPQLSRWKDVFHISDRAVIYLFIAGSYTPWLTLIPMGYWGSQMKWVVWLLSILGITYQYMFHEQYKLLETVFYVFIGIFLKGFD